MKDKYRDKKRGRADDITTDTLESKSTPANEMISAEERTEAEAIASWEQSAASDHTGSSDRETHLRRMREALLRIQEELDHLTGTTATTSGTM